MHKTTNEGGGGSCDDDDSAEPTMSMHEILQNFKDLEKEAEEKEKEHWGEESVCTYDKGYINQPVYACLTCSKACGKPVGVCYGCYLNCHLNHDTVELFYKHHFKCDCGTARIPDFDCTLIKDGDQLHFYENDENEYNHNFEGHFCWCDKFYNAGAETDALGRACKKGVKEEENAELGNDGNNTDKDNDEDESQMIQCIACEDWFHGNCIKSHNGPEYTTPDERDYEDFICDKCHEMYRDIFDRYTAIYFDSKEPLVAPDSCPFNKEAEENKKLGKCLFLRDEWCKALCRCAECSARYASSKNPWIFELPTTKEDEKKDREAQEDRDVNATTTQPVQNPGNMENRGLITPTKLEMEGIYAMDKSLEHTQKYTLFHGLTHFNESFKRFLSEKEGNIVTEQDIQDFVEELKEKDAKKRKMF